jgi:hypothetical protein
MKIYCIKKNYQGHDMDHWQHWLENSIQSYHKTEELANEAIANLIKDKAYDSHLIWDKDLGDTRNILTYYVGSDNDEEKAPIYFVETIEVQE